VILTGPGLSQERLPKIASEQYTAEQ
jgi:hypothetical protein